MREKLQSFWRKESTKEALSTLPGSLPFVLVSYCLTLLSRSSADIWRLLAILSVVLTLPAGMASYILITSRRTRKKEKQQQAPSASTAERSRK